MSWRTRMLCRARICAFALFLGLAVACAGTSGGPGDSLVGSETIGGGVGFGGGGGSDAIPSGVTTDSTENGSGAEPDNPNQRTQELDPLVRELALGLIADLESDDLAVLARAERGLIEIGRVIVPLLDDEIGATIIRERREHLRAIRESIIFGARGAARDDATAPTDPTIDDGDADGAGESGSAHDPNPASGDLNDPPLADGQPRIVSALELLAREIEGAEFDRRVIATYIWRRAQDARDAFMAHDYAVAKRLAEAILVIEPTFTYAAALRTVIQESADRLAAGQIVWGRVSAVRSPVTFGEPARFRIALRNVARVPITLVFSRVEAGRDFEDTEYFSPCVVYDAFHRWTDPRHPYIETTNKTLEIRGRVDLAPGGIWHYDYTVETATAVSEMQAIGKHVVTAEIRPLQVLVDGHDQGIRRVHCEPAEVQVLPTGYAEDQRNPLSALRHALAGSAPVRVFVAAWHCRDADETLVAGVGQLMKAIGDSLAPDIRNACFRALNMLTGYTFAGRDDESRWRAWYEANKDRPRLGIARTDAGADADADDGGAASDDPASEADG